MKAKFEKWKVDFIQFILMLAYGSLLMLIVGVCVWVFMWALNKF